MNKLFLALAGPLLAASCSDKYMVQGTSSVEGLEGKMLYLKVYADDDMQNVDSSRVIHGRFQFCGHMDSTVMANVFLGSTGIMPVVLEGGEVTLTIDESLQSATGTPLNDSLTHFIQRKTQIDARLAELPHLESQMIMDGMEHDAVLDRLSHQSRELEAENDALITSFIRTNYNNVLGPGVFMILTSGMPYPILNPQIESIITQAPPYFLQNPYVRQYIQTAEENMEKLREVK